MEEYEYIQDQQSIVSNILKGFLKTLGWISCLIVLAGIGLFAYYVKDSPSISKLQMQSAGSSKLYSKDGKYLLTLGNDKAKYVHLVDIPQTTRDAVISIEDKRFYSEKLGLDPIRIFKSTIMNVKGHEIAAGGSTITQQLVKLSAFSTSQSDRTLKRKAQEAWLAMKISGQFSKDQILEFYINKVYMNYNIYGLGTAAQEFYGKNLKELDLAQTALLAGMPNAPVSYDPYVYPEQATYRRNLVLKAMLDNKKITQAEYLKAKSENIQNGLIKLKSSKNSQRRKIDDPYIKEVISECYTMGFDPYKDRLKITTNMDQDAQNKLYDLANNKIKFESTKQQVATTVLDPNTGGVVAIIGGRKLPDVQLGLNRAMQIDRSTGSAIKPILDYAPALEYKGWSTAQSVEDNPYFYRGTNIQLFDWDNQYLGKMTMRVALEQSRNVPAVKTLDTVGIKEASKFSKTLGINIPKNSGLSVGIGANASTTQLAGAYGAFANNGVYHVPKFVRKIDKPDGTTIYSNSSGTHVMKRSTAYMMTDMLKGVINSGSGTSAKISGVYQAGKTGTVKYSQYELAKYPAYRNTPKDSWFVGYTKNYVVSVWTGFDHLSQGTLNTIGQTTSQQLYKQMMMYLMQDKTSEDWNKPSSVVERYVNGKKELYLQNHAPAEKDDSSVSESKKASQSKSMSPKQTIPSQRQNTLQPQQRANGSTQNANSQAQRNTPNQGQQYYYYYYYYYR